MPRATVSRRRSQDWLRELEEDRGTAGTSVARALVPAATRTAAALLTEDADDIRHRIETLSVDAGDAHQRVYQHEWSVLTQQRKAQNPLELLNELAEEGFAWRDIARLVGVSVPAVQKWRKGDRLSGDNRHKLASLLAARDFIASHYYVDDIASWFEMRIIDGAPVTPIDLWTTGQQILFFEYVTRHLTPEETMNEFDPEWRERYRSDFETFRDSDGNLGLRMRDR
jgi:transcriptional regulator with XRE-family HTH domain